MMINCKKDVKLVKQAIKNGGWTSRVYLKNLKITPHNYPNVGAYIDCSGMDCFFGGWEKHIFLLEMEYLPVFRS